MGIVDKLFGKLKETRPWDEDGEPATAPLTSSANQNAGIDRPGCLRIGMASHVGLVRTHNEDALVMLTAGQLGHMAEEQPFGLFVLADGMGGHQAGEVASLMAARTVARHLVLDILSPYLDNEGQSQRKTIAEALTDAVMAADKVVNRQVPGGGTTLTCALVMGDHIYIGHVGDSRAYVFENEALRQITQDHSLVDRLVEMGQISPQEALHHPQRNVLYRAVGQGDALEVDTYIESMPCASERHAQVILCSDGLWGMISDEQMVAILLEATSPQQACENLIVAANAAGGKDNITVVVIARE